MGGKGWGGNFDWGFVWRCIPVNAQGAQWDCKCIPVNAQGDQRGCIVSRDGPGVQRDWVGVCVCVWGRWRETWVRVYSSIFHILYSIRYIYILYSIFYTVYVIFYILYCNFYILYSIFCVLRWKCLRESRLNSWKVNERVETELLKVDGGVE